MPRLQILSRVDGAPTEYGGKYVKKYDPDYHLPDGSYDGGILEVTENPREAIQASPTELLELWRKPVTCHCHAMRPWYSHPNRPLTAFHCVVA